MNIDELEKLARAADMLAYEIMLSDDKYMQFSQEYGLISAANPAAILELIDSNKKLLRSLESAANYIDTLGGSSLGIRQSIARAKWRKK